MCVIIVFGVELYGHKALKGHDVLPLWPENISDFATFVGIATFGYGTCSLAFPVEESMAVPSDFPKAARWSLAFVWVVYALVGDGIASLFIYDSRGIASNILRNLPLDAWSAHLVKLSMCAVCLLTFPLTFIPSAQMLEQILQKHILRLGAMCGCTGAGGGVSLSGGDGSGSANGIGSLHAPYSYSTIGAPDHEMVSLHTGLSSDNSNYGSRYFSKNSSGKGRRHSDTLNIQEIRASAADMTPSLASHAGASTAHTPEMSTTMRVVHRFFLMIILQVVSLHVPCFGLVVSLLGCFTVSILSFVLPPLLSIQIITSPSARVAARASQRLNMHPSSVVSSSGDISKNGYMSASGNGTSEGFGAGAGAGAGAGVGVGLDSSKLLNGTATGHSSDYSDSSGDEDNAYYRDIALVVIGSLTTIAATAIVAAQCITDLEIAEC